MTNLPRPPTPPTPPESRVVWEGPPLPPFPWIKVIAGAVLLSVISAILSYLIHS